MPPTGSWSSSPWPGLRKVNSGEVKKCGSEEVNTAEALSAHHDPRSTSALPNFLTSQLPHFPTSSLPHFRTSSSLLEENLRFLASNLSPKRDESSRETIRRYLCDSFFKDHLQTYKNRPIYWCFTSGKQKAFQCLVYLHRYNEGTLARMRMEYVVPLQSKMAARIDKLGDDIQVASTSAQAKRLQKERDKLTKQLDELRRFDEQLRHYADQRIALDLDDGVKVNYGKFGDSFFVGFFAKFSVLQSVVAAGYMWLAIVAVLFSLIGAFYYLRVVKVMYFDAPSEESPLLAGMDMRVLVSLNGLAVALFGVFPDYLMFLCNTVLAMSFGT